MMVGSSIGCLSFIAAAFIEDVTSIVFLIGTGAGMYSTLMVSQHMLANLI